MPGLFYWWKNINFLYISNWPCFCRTCDETWNLDNPSQTSNKANTRICAITALRMISPFFRDTATCRWVIGFRRFWTTVVSRKVGSQKNGYLEVNTNLSYTLKLSQEWVNILMNIFSALRTYGKSVKLATSKITFPSASYMGDPRFKSRTWEEPCLTEQFVVPL